MRPLPGSVHADAHAARLRDHKADMLFCLYAYGKMPVALAQARARTCDLYSSLQACLARAPCTAFVHAVVQ
eukprot:3392825-Pleurochrysis_carterae.AAC.1